MSSTISRIVPGNGFEPQTLIKSSEVDAELDQLVAAHNSLVTDKLERDGTQAMLSNLPMGGNKLTNLGDGTASGDSVEYDQWQASIASTIAAAMLLDGTQNMAADINIGGFKTVNMAAGTTAGDAIEYQQWLTKNNTQDAEIAALSTGYSRRTAVIAIAISTAPPPTEVLGDRYILDTSGAPNAAWDGAAQNDIVEFNGSVWEATTPLEGYITYVDDENKDAVFVDDGTPAWELRPVIITSHLDLSDIGTKTHTEIDTHLTGSGADHSDVALNNTHRGSDGKNHSDVVLNNTHRGSAGTDHSDVVLNNSHRISTTNPHSVTKTQVGLSNVTNDAQLKASQLQTTITDDDTKVPSSGAVVDYVTANAPVVPTFKGIHNGGTTASVSASIDVESSITAANWDAAWFDFTFNYSFNAVGVNYPFIITGRWLKSAGSAQSHCQLNGIYATGVGGQNSWIHGYTSIPSASSTGNFFSELGFNNPLSTMTPRTTSGATYVTLGFVNVVSSDLEGTKLDFLGFVDNDHWGT